MELLTSAIRWQALEGGEIATWKQIVVAIKRDPYGALSVKSKKSGDLATLRHFEGLAEVLDRAATLGGQRAHRVCRHVRPLIERVGTEDAGTRS